jgi:DNA-binding NarL/FixJ family response regulator
MAYRVLIADDFELLREGIASVLEASGEIEVVGHAENGLEAVERARELRPDVLMLDLRMAGHGGMEALNVCREEIPEVRVLVLTANENPDKVRSAMAAGATGYLTKQATGDDLCAAVLAVVGGTVVISPSLVDPPPVEDAEPSAANRTVAQTLTARQRTIVRLLSSGLTDAEIAAQLFVSARTVQYDIKQVKDEAGLAHRSEIARWAVINSLA